MLIKESQYTNSLQKYNKKDVDAIVAQEPRLSQRFLMKICDFVLGEKIPFNDVRVLFAKIQDGNLMIPNINSLDYLSLKEVVDELYKSSQEEKLLFDNPFWVSDDKTIEIYLIHNYGDVKRLPFQNSWCIKDEDDYKYHAYDKSTTMYLIVNKRCSICSNIRYVMAEVYPENEVDPEQTIFWATDNEVLGGSKLNEYLMSLGDGANKIQLIPESIKRNIYKYNQNYCNRNMRNKKVVRLTESQLRNMIAESVRHVLNENEENDSRFQQKLQQALQRLKLGLGPWYQFDYCGDVENGYAQVKLNGRWNLCDLEKRTLVSPNQWFDFCQRLRGGHSAVELNGKWNFIDTEGNIVSPNQWFDGCSEYGFQGGHAAVELNGKWNFIDTEGNIVSPNQWFDGCSGNFHKGYAVVELNGKWNLMDTEGNLYDYDTKQPLGINVKNMNN